MKGRTGGIRRALRENGLGIVTFSLFFLCLLGQSLAGLRSFNDELREHGQKALTYLEFLASGEFIETVFENWQSEFLSIGVLVMLSIYLREKGSPESKPVAAAYDEDAA